MEHLALDVPYFSELSRWLEKNDLAVAIVGGVSLLTLVGTALLLPWLVSRMSEDYFVNGSRTDWAHRHPAVRVLFHVVKNLLGTVLVLAGLAMIFLPGQGVLTILIGVSLLDFPGKRRMELAIARQRHVRRAIAWIRRRAGEPPLRYPEEVTQPERRPDEPADAETRDRAASS